MRSLGVVVALCSMAFAGSKPADIEKLLKQNLAAVAARKPDDALGITKDAIIFPALTRDPELGGPSIAGEMAFFAGGAIKHVPGKPVIGLDDAKGIAWFQIPYRKTITADDESLSGDGGYDGKARLGGIAVRDGTTTPCG